VSRLVPRACARAALLRFLRVGTAFAFAFVALALPRLARAATPLVACEAQLRSIAEADLHLDEAGARCEGAAWPGDPLGDEGLCGTDGTSRAGFASPVPLAEHVWIGGRCDGVSMKDGSCVHFGRGVMHVQAAGDDAPPPPAPDRDQQILPAIVPGMAPALLPPEARELAPLPAVGHPARGATSGIERPPRA